MKLNTFNWHKNIPIATQEQAWQ